MPTSNPIDLEHAVFESNLQEFCGLVSSTCNLAAGGKLSPEQCFERISASWFRLQRSRVALGLPPRGPSGRAT